MNSPRQPEDRTGGLDSSVVAPVVPTAQATVRLLPVGLLRNRIEGGLWADRRRVNHEVTIPHGAAQLEAAGNLFNFRLAAGAASGSYLGGDDDGGSTAPFLDSDVHKWLEAVGWELAQGHDQAMLALAEPMIDLIAKAQRQDGYVDTFWQVARPGEEFTDLEWGHELYVAGHLVQAAVAWKRGVGDDRLLRVAERFVGRIEAEMGPGKRELVCGHPEFEMALVELYRLTGEARHLEFARTLVERRGQGLLGWCRHGTRYWQDYEPVRAAAEPTGHSVRQMYLDCGVVDVAVETGDRELLESAIRRWDSMVATRTYLTGGLGVHHRDEAFGDAFELPPDRAYAETCAAIGSVMLSWRLLLATGENRFADLIERTAFNAVLPGLALDGSHFFYSNPLMRRSGGVEILEGAATTRRANWFVVSCCPPNLMRFLATFPDQVATVDGRGVQLHQFASGSLDAPVAGGSVKITTRTSYPWDGDVEMSIVETVADPWSLSLRVPEWCSKATASLDGSGALAESGPGVIDVTRAWRAGDRIVLRLAMPPRVTVPDPRIDAVRGSVALERGPLVYAVEDADLPAGKSVESLEVDPEPQVGAVTESLTGLGEMTNLSLEATIRDDPQSTGWPYASATPETPARSTPPATVKATVRAIPYFAWANRAGLGMRVWLPTRSNPKGSD
ncbi:MAG: beta-L-arabinofuranosidase domain-containing protein [Candidatus Limnocylindrales bacterium]